MSVALQVFLGMALFAIVAALLVVVRRWQVASWRRVRPILGPTALVALVALAGCALAAAIGYGIAGLVG